MKRNRSIVLLTALFAATSATAAKLEAVQAGVALSPSSNAFSMQGPADWLCIRAKTHVGCSRDGFMLNGITVDLRPHAKAFPNIKKPSAVDTPPEELAETLVADLSALKTIRDVKLVSVEPAELAGHPAFRARMTYRLDDMSGGAAYDMVVVGSAVAKGFLVATYEAPHLNYFEKSLPAFEAVVPTIVLLEGVK